MATRPPVIHQIVRNQQATIKPPINVNISAVEDYYVYDRHGGRFLFKDLYKDKKTIIIFVRNFLCYACKEYVEDLAKIPSSLLTDAGVRLVLIGQSSHAHIQSFCSLTEYRHEMYVDPERHIYKKLGMKRGESATHSASRSPHVKSSLLFGSARSIWRAMTSPAFDFQGDPHQQGGALIAGPGSEVHFAHFDMNRLDHMPINWLLQLAGIQTVDFSDQPRIIDV
ncbi:peroxiredoxin-like 2C isoform X1 [Paramormyrops kingsleyae]|uniref:Peroxiredoxin like 2C n=1 Tax=Paramormyrops kingsleyae TaxID=1676925 RepID=A0A3B3TCB4_9TELE|nr:thioredoxin-like protein AAED1 isoform X1 [Paramormyrops kingsleyae]